MARRPDPVRIRAAKLAGTRARLISSGVSPERVDALIAEYEDMHRGEPLESEDLFRWVLSRPRR